MTPPHLIRASLKLELAGARPVFNTGPVHAPQSASSPRAASPRAAPRFGSSSPAGRGGAAERRCAGHLGRRRHRVPPRERTEDPDDPRPLDRHDHRQRHLSRRVAPRRLRRDRNGASARAPDVPRDAALSGHQGGLPAARGALQRQHRVRPDQLLRDFPCEREDARSRSGGRGRPHGERPDRSARSRRGDDRCAQRVRVGGEQRVQRAARARRGERLSLAQLRTRDHRGAIRHRERPDRAAAGVLPAILPAGQRGGAGVGQAGRIDRAWAGAETFRRDFEAVAQATRDLYGRAYPGRGAYGHAAALGRRAAGLGALEGFARNPVTEDEVERARTRLLNDIELTLADSRELTSALSEYAGIGDWRVLFLHRDRLKRITADDVQAVALHYLKPANRTLGMFLPTKEPDRAEIPPVPDLAAMLKDYRGSGAVAQGESFNPDPANIEARVVRRTLPGGMKLALLPKKTRGGTVVAQLGLQWGDEQGKLNRAAACGVTGSMLMRGTRKNSREQLLNRFDRLKANVSIGGEGGSIETVRAGLPEALRLMAEVLREPSFPRQEFEQLRRSSLTGIDSQRSDPGVLAGLALARHLNPYPPEHWLYTATLDERSARLQALSLDEVRKCYADFYGASDSELAVVGDFDPAEIARLAQELFGGWKSPRPYARIPLRIAEVPAVNSVINTPDKANAALRAGMLLRLRDDNPDYPALLLGNYVLGGSSDSRLTRRIREKEGLSYSVGSFLSADSFFERGSFGVFAIYAPQNRARVETAMTEEIRKALDEGFSGEEIEAGKKGLLQARQLARSDDGNLASRLASYLVLGRTFSWDEELERRIAALTPKTVVETLRRYIDPGKLSVVKAGDFASLAASPSGPSRAN